jgi:antitoxin HicB
MMPHHPSKEIASGTLNAILRQLGLKGKQDMIQYQAEFKPEGDVIAVTFPDVGYGATQGATEAEALEMAEDFLLMAIDGLIKQGKDLPVATTRRGRKYRWIQLPLLAGVKVELYRELKGSGVRKAELARRLKISRGNIDRLFDLHHSTRLELLEAAFAALGRRLLIGVEKAARRDGGGLRPRSGGRVIFRFDGDAEDVDDVDYH